MAKRMATLALLALTATSLLAGDPLPIRAQLRVTAEKDEDHAAVVHYMSDALQRLSGVTLTETGKRYMVNVTILRVPFGAAMSAVVTLPPSDCDIEEDIKEGGMSRQEAMDFEEISGRYGGAVLMNDRNVEKLCERVAIYLDGQFFAVVKAKLAAVTTTGSN